MNILEKLAALSRERVAADQLKIPAAEMQSRAEALGPGNGAAFLTALKRTLETY